MTENKAFNKSMGFSVGRSIERKEGKYVSILLRTNCCPLHVARGQKWSIYHQAAGWFLWRKSPKQISVGNLGPQAILVS